MWAAIYRLDWTVEGLSEGWSIALEAAQLGFDGAVVRTFHQKAPRWLAVLEEQGAASLGDIIGGDQERLSARAREAVVRLRELGARNGNSVGPTRTGTVKLAVGAVGPTPGTTINEAVETTVRDNIDKLRRAEADERHLFVWVDSSNALSESAMAQFDLPLSPPDLEPGIDTVWIAAWMRGVRSESNIYMLWRLTPGQGWQSLPVPLVGSYARERCLSPEENS
jgi:hypothetical protein